jgi:4'-phosphopantetheinyl transferase EntD
VLSDLLPDSVVCVDAFDDRQPAPLFPEEEGLVAAAVENRRREFATARRCAREALTTLGFPATAIPGGPVRQPCWPPGVVGSITHCAGYRAAAVARSEAVATLGVDAEPHERLPDGVLRSIAAPQEASWVRDRAAAEPLIWWDRLLFSAKESVYKAWFPLAGSWLGFEDVVIQPGRDLGTFTVRLRPTEPPQHSAAALTRMNGRWLIRRGLVLTAVAIPSSRNPI